MQSEKLNNGYGGNGEPATGNGMATDGGNRDSGGGNREPETNPRHCRGMQWRDRGAPYARQRDGGQPRRAAPTGCRSARGRRAALRGCPCRGSGLAAGTWNANTIGEYG